MKKNKNIYSLIYGGNNKQHPPFSVGDTIKQRYTTDKDGNLIDGRAILEFVGMKDDMMLLKTLNNYAAHAEDELNPEVVRMAKKAGFKPTIGQTTQLHYMYADRYEVIKLCKACGSELKSLRDKMACFNCLTHTP